MAYLLPHLLTESAARFPDREAIRFQGQGITYAELDAITNRMARALISAGLQKGDRVGIYLHKSPASVYAIFGILKAGGVYVPMDPNSPVKRLAFIARNCDIGIVISSAEKQAQLSQLLDEPTPLRAVIVAGEVTPDLEPEARAIEVITWEGVRGMEAMPVDQAGTIENDLAYILYTSGSTGDPKGVMIAHRTIFTFINWCHDTFKMTEHDRVTSHAPFHFDLSTFDLFVTIKAGGTVVLVPEKLSVFPMHLVQLLQDEAITVTYMVPSILSLMVTYGRLGTFDLSALRLMLFAGEVFPIKYLRELVQSVPHPDYYNLYGPTETNVCTYYRVLPDDVMPGRDKPVPIGMACENMAVFAVDEHGQLVNQPGVEGELWARGSCVALGYWGDDERSAARFVPNPFQPEFKEIAYRTGDIVVLDEDGRNWRLVGRRDHMIKSRGYRIELGEIESVLYKHELVQEAAVVAIPDDLVGNRIKAFVVPAGGTALNSKELQDHCGRSLPRYMVPESIEFMADLPKTSTGKVNRTLLTAL